MGRRRSAARIRSLAVSVALASQAVWAQAPEAPEQDPAGIGDEPVVHSQVASFAVTQLKDSPAVVSVITQEEIRSSGARDLIDILLLVPGFSFGVDVQGIVGPGFRGLWGYEGKTLLLIDGKEMNELLYSTIQLGHEFPVELIERVEVVRGPGSVIYGGNAELAVINVITRGVQGGTDVMASGTYGQYPKDYARRGGVVSARKVFESVPGLSMFASAGYQQGQRSDRRYTDDFGTSYKMAGSSQLDPSVIQAGVGYKDLQASFLYHRYYTTAGDGYDAAAIPPVIGDFQSYHAELVDTFRPSDRFELTPRLTYLFQKPWRTLDQASPFYYDKQAQRFRGRLTARWAPLDFLQLTGGADVALDYARVLGVPDVGFNSTFNRTGATGVQYQNYAGFLEAYSENPIVNVVAGARYENNSRVGQSFVPRLVLLKELGPVSLKALYSRAFRAPGVENISAGVAIRPERTQVFEIVATVRLGEGHTLSVNAFDMGIQAPLSYSFDAATNTEVYRNLGRVGSRGLEMEYGLRGKWGRVAANYSFYQPSGRSDVAYYQVPGHTESFAGLPTHKATATGTVKILKWLSFSPSVILLGPRYSFGPLGADGGGTVLTQPTQLLLNAFVRAENVGLRGLDLGLGAYNILGVNMAAAQPYDGGHAPLPILGREFMLRVMYTFDAQG